MKGATTFRIAQPGVYMMVTSDRTMSEGFFFFLWGMVAIDDGFIKGSIAS